MEKERHGQDQLIPFLWLRRGIGLLGIFFPITLYLGSRIFGDCPILLNAISDYYHTNMRDVFVGVLCVLSLFLFTYRGYTQTDNYAANFASVFALGIAFFPTSIKDKSEACFSCEATAFPVLHNVSAAAFFLTLTYFCLVLFPKIDNSKVLTADRKLRRKVYKICGYLMLVCVILTGIVLMLDEYFNVKNDWPMVFILEWIALWAFGVSWIVKGGWLIGNFKTNNV
jgi:hypothetical protein